MADTDTIRCMQLPLTKMQLLVPNSAVAEIIGYDRPQADEDSDWYEGKIPWRGVDVPVVSVESMCQMESVEPGGRTRIAVLYNPQGDDALPYIGVILQDIPRAYLAEAERMTLPIDSSNCEFLMTRVDEMMDNLVIADIDSIVRALRQQLGV